MRDVLFWAAVLAVAVALFRGGREPGHKRRREVIGDAFVALVTAVLAVGFAAYILEVLS